MTPTSNPTGAPPAGAPTGESPVSSTVATTSRRRIGIALATILLVALAVCLATYLVFAGPDHWFGGARTLTWKPADMQVTRGVGRMAGEELLVAPADASGLVVVSLRTTIKSADYAAIEWNAIDVPADVSVALLWRTDYKPAQVNSIPLTMLSGRLLPVVTRDHAAWIGNIEGLALAITGRLAEPVRVRGVTAKSRSAADLVGDRAREWLAFEHWSGTSINTVNGGADLQELPLPVLLAAAVAVATLIVAGLRRAKPGAVPVSTAAALLAFALAAWLLLDTRWMWNLARQVEATAERFAGKSWVDQRLAVEDGPLFAFVQEARQRMPSTPVRVIVAADSDYFRGRAAYHLYPHNVFFLPRANSLPEPRFVKPGSWFLVYHRRGVQFDAAKGLLRWDNLAPVRAELKLAGRGAALFEIR